LFDLKNSGTVQNIDIEMLKREIINNKAMINKSWLLEKIAEMEGII
jgi:hypothetical protein